MKHILTTLILTLASASAHPGHPGHEDWPFDDFSWSIVAVAIVAVVAGTFTVQKLRGGS
ncbi:MAG: hypothetical protein GWQ05_25195 [Verrucomicrobiaceae bacterium]|jgi:hypothetical protein|nr:hypothetical protein [Verrucomicrobiales bacterium]NCF94226.1 hypothetical protein [Verrucomicrobiaceae bacterium]